MTRLVLLAGLVLTLAACQEQLSAPADCPASCPGGRAEALDTVILADLQRDSTFEGFIPALSGGSALVSTGLPDFDARAVFRFSGIPDSFGLTGIRRGYTIDSIVVNMTVLERDTAAKSLELLLYRVPATTDTAFSYADALAASGGTPTLRVPLVDTLRTGVARVLLTGAQLAPLAIAPADSGEIAFVVGLSSATPTGVRLQNNNALTSLTNLVHYIRLIGVDSLSTRQILTGTPEFVSYVASARPPAPSGALVVGGEPSSRSVLRFTLPRVIRDSAALVRATLELVPVGPITGVPNLPTLLSVRSVLADFGAKSPLETGSTTQPVPAGSADTVRVEVGRIVSQWQGPNGRVQTIFLQTSPEGASWSRFAFGSSAGTQRPRLRITYLRAFPFEAP